MSEARRPAMPAQQSPASPRRSRVVRPGDDDPVTVPVPEGFEARDGDVLVVAYPEVTLPLRVKYAMVKVGDCSYTRQLRVGDDVNEQFERINRWLSAQVEGDLRRKVAAYMAELQGQETR